MYTYIYVYIFIHIYTYTHTHTLNHSVKSYYKDTIFFFLLSVHYSISYMRYSTLYNKVGFVLDDVAQLCVNVRILSTFKVD